MTVGSHYGLLSLLMLLIGIADGDDPIRCVFGVMVHLWFIRAVENFLSNQIKLHRGK